MADIDVQLKELRALESLLPEQLVNLLLASAVPALAATTIVERADICRRLIERVILPREGGSRPASPVLP